MQFKDVIGQEELKQHLRELVQQNRLSHALLFLGKEGSGGLPLALAFTQYIVCEKVNGKSASNQPVASLFDLDELPKEETKIGYQEACGECAACMKASQMIHPDIHFSYPVIPKKTGDKPKSTDHIASWREFVKQSPYGNVYDWLQFINAENRQGNITAEECNDIIKQLSLKSFESEYKILVMWMPEYMGNEGNRLLKLIEEPPPNTLFVFVAENEEKILQTILSRTQLVRIPLLDDSAIEQALIERNQTPPEQARLVAGIAQGRYREALQLLQHSEEDWLSMLRNWMNVTVKKNQPAQIKWIGEVQELGREKQKQFLRYFNHVIEQCVRLRVMGEEYVTLSESEKEFAQKFNKITGVSQQQAIIKLIDDATYFIERNANAKMLFHAVTIKIQHLIKDKVLVSIV